MAGRDMRPMVTTVAPTIPVLAANRVPTIIMEILKPELVFLKTIAISLNILAAMPDLSKTTPMKTNRGTASRVWLFMIPKMRMGRVLNKLGSKKSNAIPRSANKIEVPASVNATG
jgi:hypothetical protein